jgi:hypothetical protein
MDGHGPAWIHARADSLSIFIIRGNNELHHILDDVVFSLSLLYQVNSLLGLRN